MEDAESDVIERQLGEVAGLAAQNAEVRKFLAHPLVPREEKSAFLTRVLPDASEPIRNFLILLVRNRREAYLEWIYREFIDIQAEAQGRVQVAIQTAQELSDEDKQRLRERLEEVLHRPVQVTEHVDPDLLGGLRIETDGHVLDATIRARLDELRKTMEE
jgi:F-type H+-transporting ATPase subunit delta